MCRALLLAPTLTIPIAFSAAAQQPPTFSETVVVTATAEEQPAEETSAAATVFTRADIERSGAFAVAELLRRVPGATLLRSGGDNGVTSLFVRGTNAAHTLVLLDGVRLSSPFFGGYDWSVPLTAGVGRAEVVRGPYSALYGSDAVGGVVQLVSRRAVGESISGFVEGGSAGWRRGEITVSHRSGALDLLASGAWREGSGELDNDDFSSDGILVNGGLSFSWGRLGLLAGRTSSSTEIPFSGASATPNRETAATERIAALPIRLALGPESELEVTLSHVERTLAFRDPDDPWGFVRSDTDADSDGARAVWRLGWRGHRLVLGGEWREDQVDDRSNFGVTLDGERLTTTSGFVQDSFSLGRRLDVLLGARWDEADPWGSQVSPRITLSWRGAVLRTWMAWGRAFRAPSLGELYYPFSGNPALDAEHSRSAELGVAVPMAGGRSQTRLVVFHNRVDDLVDFDYVDFRYANIARAAQDGVELSVAAATSSRSGVSLSLSWLDARDGDGKALLRRPAWSSCATFHGTFLTAIEAELNVLWVGPRPDIDPLTYARVDQGGFVTASAAVAFPVSSWLNLRLRSENLADGEYEEVRGYPAPRRRFMVGAGFTID